MPSRRLSPARRMVCDFLRAGRHAEFVTFERTVQLPAVALARRAVAPPPSWPAVFAKAAGVVAGRCPELRQAYLPWPTPRVYEHPITVCSVVVAREIDGDEYLLLLPLADPGAKPLAELDAKLKRAKSAPVREVSAFRRALRAGRLPGPVRRAAWGLLDWSGRLRVGQLGTFGISVTAGWGAEATTLRTPWATALHYGTIAADGSVPLRLTIDHRVMDGRAACRILAGIEEAVNGPVRAELEAMRSGRLAAA